MILGILLILISLPLMIIPIIGIPLFIVGIIVVLLNIGKSNSQKTADATASALMAAQEKRDKEQELRKAGETDTEFQKWVALVKYDDDIGAAVTRLEPLGAGAVEQLRTTYTALGDKSKLDRIVTDIESEYASAN